jgi:hypothetical protein
MKDLKDYIKESNLNEARITLNSLSDVDLFTLYWDEWSGYANGEMKSGTSQNPKARRIGEYIYDRYDVYGKPAGSGFDPSYCIQALEEFACEELKVSEFERGYTKKIAARMHELIKINIDWILAGIWRDKKGIKSK